MRFAGEDFPVMVFGSRGLPEMRSEPSSVENMLTSPLCASMLPLGFTPLRPGCVAAIASADSKALRS